MLDGSRSLGNMHGSSLIKVAVLGSCVSRDLLEFSLSHKASCEIYVARQSIISLDRPTQLEPGIDLNFKHSFQEKAVMSDLIGSGLSRILENGTGFDLLLMDVMDERHGVYISNQGVITRSIDGIQLGLYKKIPHWKHIDFGTAEHLKLYSEASHRLGTALRERQLLEKTIVIEAPWATHMSTGERAPSSMGKLPDWANSKIRSYYKTLRNEGFNLIRPGAETVFGDAAHKWGPAPFHYIQQFYDSLASQILKKISIRN